MVVASCAVLTFLIFLTGWRLDNRFSFVLTPYMIFSVYFLSRAVPGFLVGIERHALDAWYAGILPVALFGWCLGYFASARTRLSGVGLWVGISHLHTRWSYERALVLLAMAVVATGLALYGGVPPAIEIAIKLVWGSIDPLEAAQTIAEARREISKEHIFSAGAGRGSGVLREVIFLSSLLMLSLAAVYALAIRGARAKVILVACILISYVFVSGDGTRGRFIVVATALVVAYTLYRRVRTAHVVIGLVGIVALSVFLGLYTNKMIALVVGHEWSGILLATLERIFVGNSVNDALAIKAIESGFLEYGNGYWLLRDLVALLPGIDAGRPLAYYLYLFEVGGDSTTYLTGTSLSRAYVDGGVSAVFIYFAVLGALAGTSKRLVQAVPGLPHGQKLALLVAIWLAVGQGYVSGIAGVLFLLIGCTMLASMVALLRFDRVNVAIGNDRFRKSIS